MSRGPLNLIIDMLAVACLLLKAVSCQQPAMKAAAAHGVQRSGSDATLA